MTHPLSAELREMAERCTRFHIEDETFQSALHRAADALDESDRQLSVHAKYAALFMAERDALIRELILAEALTPKTYVLDLDAAELLTRAEKAEAQAARYREALEGYADPANYERSLSSDPEEHPIWVLDDCGKVARQALSDPEEKP